MQIKLNKTKVEIGQIPKEKKKGVIYFESFEEMNKVLTSNRLEILNVIKEENPESIYELAQLLKKDQGNITKDVNLLEKYGFLEIHKQKKGGRVSSKPICEIDNLEMVIKIGAGIFGIAKNKALEISKEFKGEKLNENKRYASNKTKDVLKPIKNIADKISNKLDK